ncbi:hypothetical protein EV356DRAFT_214958 [Viridothelium virens]|uniref:NACHT domain-containing protein n=1 Tax=Viridothelium virens TaxID=1048519 RepID=A0A6A6H5K4_VIRVR|nr:hypothetical protein EV356DRAFT_214958 [Viridothelium virens]
MLPLDALGVAAAAVQFIDFTCNFISKTNQIRKDGSSLEVQFVHENTSAVIAWNAGLRSRRREIAQHNDELSQLEKELDGVLLGCCSLADDLINRLAKLSATNTGIIESLRKAFLTLLSKEKLGQLSTQLQEYRNNLNTYILAILNEKLEKHHGDFTTRLDCLEKEQKEIKKGQDKVLEVLTFSTHSSVAPAKLDRPFTSSEHDVLQSLLSESELREGKAVETWIQDERPISAIALVSNEGGNTSQVYLSPQQHESIVVPPLGAAVSTTVFRPSPGGLHANHVFTEKFKPLVQSVLNALNSSSLQLRKDEISQAHKETFKWIFERCDCPENQEGTGIHPKTTGFIEFLESQGGFCWVNGKPGSGKSTLMKFVHDHKRTEDALKVWSANCQLLIASHFFWSAGIELQKSQAGLLRSILTEIVLKFPALVPAAFPETCRQLLHHGFVDAPNFTNSDLRMALRRVLTVGNTWLRVCLFIDGADEFAGPPIELCDLLNEIVAFPCAKAVVSSRPWNVFNDQFGGSPSIRVQDLTVGDIQAYVETELKGNLSLAEFFEQNPSMGASFVEQITQRASGVFLWVLLVVRSLIRGWRDGDRPEELQAKLDGMPADLEGFYNRMFESMEPTYQDQAAQMFLILLRNIELRLSPISVLQMSFAGNDTLEDAIKAPQRLVLAQERSQIHASLERRLLSRTNCLIEVVRQSADEYAGSSAIDMRVEFLHKTVVDFLYLPRIQEKLAAYKSSYFDPDARLLAAGLHEIKVLPMENAIIVASDRVWCAMWDCFNMVEAMESRWRRPYTAVLDELDRTMTKHWEAAEIVKLSSHEQDWKHTANYSCWSAVYKRGAVDAYLVVATFSGCVLYIANKMLGTTFIVDVSDALLAEIVYQFFEPYAGDEEKDHLDWNLNVVTAIKQLLAQGANPNASYVLSRSFDEKEISTLKRAFGNHGLGKGKRYRQRLSIWEFCVVQILSIITLERVPDSDRHNKYSPERAIELFQLCTNFLTAGAELSCAFKGAKAVDNGKLKSISGEKVPLSVGTVLERLRMASLHPAKRIFVTSIQEGDVERINAAYQEAMDVYRRRKRGGRILMEFERLQAWLGVILRSSAFQSFCTFVLGGLVVLCVARLSERSR